MTKLADARRSLVRAKEAAQERMQRLEAERREIKASIKSLDAALKALGGSKPSTSKRAAAQRPESPPSDAR